MSKPPLYSGAKEGDHILLLLYLVLFGLGLYVQRFVYFLELRTHTRVVVCVSIWTTPTTTTTSYGRKKKYASRVGGGRVECWVPLSMERTAYQHKKVRRQQLSRTTLILRLPRNN